MPSLFPSYRSRYDRYFFPEPDEDIVMSDAQSYDNALDDEARDDLSDLVAVSDSYLTQRARGLTPPPQRVIQSGMFGIVLWSVVPRGTDNVMTRYRTRVPPDI